MLYEGSGGSLWVCIHVVVEGKKERMRVLDVLVEGGMEGVVDASWMWPNRSIERNDDTDRVVSCK